MPIPAIVGGAIVAGAGSLLAQGLQNSANQANSNRTYEQDVEMWNRGNAYNAPVAQMARLKEAGLNPNLVYGNGAVGNQAGTLPKYQTPQVSYQGVEQVAQAVPSTISQYQDYQIRQAQLDNLKAQNTAIVNGAKNAEIMGQILGERLPGETFRSQILGQNWQMGNATMEDQIKAKLADYQLKLGTAPYQLQMAQGKVRNLETSNNLMLEQISTQRKNRSKTDQDIALSKILQGKGVADIMNIQGRTGMIPTQIDEIKTRMGLQKAQTELKQHEVDTYIQRMYTDMILRGAGTAVDAVKAIKNWNSGKGSAPKFDPNNKAWQKDSETHSQWMKRVNPGSN